MTKQKTTLLEQIGNIFIFKGNLNIFGFMIALLVIEFIYNFAYDYVLQKRIFIPYFGMYMGMLFCYLTGTVVAARLRNLKLNPSFAYFFVIALWALRFIATTVCNRDKLVILVLFLYLPLFAKDKKVLQFWKDEE